MKVGITYNKVLPYEAREAVRPFAQEVMQAFGDGKSVRAA